MSTEAADEAADRVTAFLDHMFTPDGKGDVIRAYASGGVQYLLTEDDLRALVTGYKDRDWQPGRWHQVRRPDGSLWMETSNQNEAEAEARKQGWPLYRLWECHETQWRLVGEEQQ